jgi:hypothetical protein
MPDHRYPPPYALVPSVDWPNDVEIPLPGGGFVAFGELAADDARAIADELERGSGYLDAYPGSPTPTTDVRLWRAFAAELDAVGANVLAEFDFDVRYEMARGLDLPAPGWALPRPGWDRSTGPPDLIRSA